MVFLNVIRTLVLAIGVAFPSDDISSEESIKTDGVSILQVAEWFHKYNKNNFPCELE